ETPKPRKRRLQTGRGQRQAASNFQDLFEEIFGGGSRRQSRGQDMKINTTISLGEAYNGVEKTVKVSRNSQCEACNGSGAEGGNTETCPECNGEGRVREVERSIFGRRQVVKECSRCSGRGEIPEKDCSDCGGEGVREVEETITFDIPAGVQDGQRLRLEGKGHENREGRSGDLYVFITVEAHESLERRGSDLYTVKKIGVGDAALGWKFKEWNGLDKETDEVTLTMNEDKSIEALFEEDVDVSIEDVSVPQTVDGDIDFNYQIANQQEEITDNFTVRLNGREVSRTEKTVSKGETINEDGPTVTPLAGDGSESAKLEIEYAGVKDSRSFRIASVQKEFVEGWNYFSLPIATSQTMNIEEIFDQDEINTIWTYENSWKNYYPGAPDNQFDTIRGGQGYIVEAEEDFSITPIVETNLSAVESDDPVKPAQNNLDAGWNLIGSYWTTGIEASDTGAYSSLPEDHITSTLYTDNDGSLSLQELGNKDMEPSEAYWISSKEEAAYTKSQEAE
ncbi:chaperone protein DnaJ, partial [Candidatus Haloredivivus sp. G17]